MCVTHIQDNIVITNEFMSVNMFGIKKTPNSQPNSQPKKWDRVWVTYLQQFIIYFFWFTNSMKIQLNGHCTLYIYVTCNLVLTKANINSTNSSSSMIEFKLLYSIIDRFRSLTMYINKLCKILKKSLNLESVKEQ